MNKNKYRIEHTLEWSNKNLKRNKFDWMYKTSLRNSTKNKDYKSQGTL